MRLNQSVNSFASFQLTNVMGYVPSGCIPNSFSQAADHSRLGHSYPLLSIKASQLETVTGLLAIPKAGSRISRDGLSLTADVIDCSSFTPIVNGPSEIASMSDEKSGSSITSASGPNVTHKYFEALNKIRLSVAI